MSPTVSLPEGASLGNSYEYGIDIDTNYPAEPDNPGWIPIRRISDLQPTPTPITQDASTYDDLGAPNAEKTSESWTLSHSVLWNLLPDGKLIPELEILQRAEKPESKNRDAVVHVRYYHKPETGAPNPDDAYEGYATVAIARANTDASGGVEKRTITYTGKGPRKSIPNPFAGWDAQLPLVTSAEPSEATEGKQVTIVGTGFTGVSGVSFGPDPATEYTVIDATRIVAVMPTGTAGDASIIVAATAGSSTPFTYTRG